MYVVGSSHCCTGWRYYIELQHAPLDTLYMSFKLLLFITIVFHEWGGRAAEEQ